MVTYTHFIVYIYPIFASRVLKLFSLRGDFQNVCVVMDKVIRLTFFFIVFVFTVKERKKYENFNRLRRKITIDFILIFQLCSTCN